MSDGTDTRSDLPRSGATASVVAAGREGSAGADLDHLADRCRALWRRGDWQLLSAHGVDDIAQHPERASLALMVATAHQALGQTAQVRLFVGLARQWGCEPQQIAGALIAGVHNTLGRAAVAAGRQGQHALRHFAEAMAPGGAASADLNLQDRVRHQLGDMQLDVEATLLLEGRELIAAATLHSPSAPPALVEALLRSSELMSTRLKEQGRQLVAVRRAIESTVRKEMANAVRQLEAHANLQRYLDAGQLMPALHGWPISPDFGVLLIDLIESGDYDLVIEFGSGTSTLLMAIALARVAQRRQRKAPAVQVAFEHLEAFHRQSRSLLERMGVAQAVQLELAGLQPWTSAHGVGYEFYACQGKLGETLQGLRGAAARALVIVDGPPAATGTHARYPALPILLPLLQGLELDVLLDDHARVEEQQVSKMWLADLEANGRRFEVSAPELDKGACLIRVHA